MTPQERIEKAREFRTRVLAARDSYREQLAEKIKELSSVKDAMEKFKRLAEMTMWAEISSGATINVGDRVRYFLKVYECKKQHTKAILRSPLNTEYWAEVEA